MHIENNNMVLTREEARAIVEYESHVVQDVQTENDYGYDSRDVLFVFEAEGGMWGLEAYLSNDRDELYWEEDSTHLTALKMRPMEVTTVRWVYV